MHCLVLLSVDLLLISISSIAALLLSSPGAAFPPFSYAAITLAVAVPVLLLLGLNRALWRFTALSDCLRVTCAVVAIVVLARLLGLYLDPLAAMPRALPVLQALLMLFTLLGMRAVAQIRHDLRKRAATVRSRGHVDCENVLVIGLSPLTDFFLYGLERNSRTRVNTIGILSETKRHHGRSIRSCKILGRPEAIESVLHDLAVHGVFISRIVMAISRRELTEKGRNALRQLEKRGDLRFDDLTGGFGIPESAVAGHMSAHDADVLTKPLPPNSYLRWKRAIDAVAALLAAIMFAPLMSVVAVAVLLDVGAPAIFWQQRPGARGRPIKVLKFRTMGSARDHAGRPLNDEARVSKVGRLLRRLRLDELPQIYNVLLGHMSLVGPRPLLPVDQPSSPAARLQMRPGLTGWAQIKGGRHLSNEDKAALDLWYIRNASFALDMSILAQTVRMVLVGDRIDRNAIHEAWQALRGEQSLQLSSNGTEQKAA